MSYPKVKIEGVDPLEAVFVRGTTEWSVLRLIEASKDLLVIEIPLCAIDLSIKVWDVDNVNDFIHHIKRVENTDLNYPIILDDNGFVCDGWHRIAKAISKGKTIIKAVRLEKMPSHDRIIQE